MSHDRRLKVWELGGFAHHQLRWEHATASELNHCQFAPDGGEVYAAGEDGILRVWAAADGRFRREYQPAAGAPPPIHAFVLSRDGGRVAWCGGAWDGQYHITTADARTLQVARRVVAHADEPMILAAYPGGFCSGADDRTVKFWDWHSAACHAARRTRGTVQALAASPDGTRVAIGGVITIAIHDRTGHGVSGKPVVCRGHAVSIRCVEFSPDGTKLASTSLDGTLRLWDAATGACLRTFALKLGGLHWVTFAPDGLTLAFSSLAGDVGLLDLDG